MVVLSHLACYSQVKMACRDRSDEYALVRVMREVIKQERSVECSSGVHFHDLYLCSNIFPSQPNRSSEAIIESMTPTSHILKA